MSFPNSSLTHESKREEKPTHGSESPDSQSPGGEVDARPFRILVKTGCGGEFVNWEECAEEAEKQRKDFVEKCASNVIFDLTDYTEATRDYYAPALQAEEGYPKILKRARELFLKIFKRTGKEEEKATDQSEKEKGSDGTGH